MINYSFSTVLMAFLSSNLVLIFLTICFCNPKLLSSIGYKALALFLCLTLLRFALPVQFPFTTNLELPDSFSKIVFSLRYVFYKNSHFKLSLWIIFELIWFIGFLILLIKEIYCSIQFEKYIRNNGKDISSEEPYSLFMNEICAGKKNPFRIICLPGCQIPKIYGIFSPCILLSNGLDLTQKELQYVLCHEASHYFHHDIIFKCCVKFVCMVYWWNPFSYFLKQQLDVIIEMRIDESIVGNDLTTIKEYTACLIKITEITIEEKEKKSHLSASLFKGTKEELVSRYQMMNSLRTKSTNLLNILLFITIISIFAFSYFYIWEAKCWTPEVTEETFGLSENNAYAILNEDGSYSLYYDGYLIDILDDLQVYTFDVPIYNSHDELPADIVPINPN